MESQLDDIKESLIERLGIRFTVIKAVIDPENMNKKLFIKVLDQLRQIEDKRDFLVEELGIDLTYYEEAYFDIILNLLKMTFTKEQIAYIQYYLYKALPDKDWDGTIVLVEDGKESTHPFGTPSEVWNILKIIK